MHIMLIRWLITREEPWEIQFWGTENPKQDDYKRNLRKVLFWNRINDVMQVRNKGGLVSLL